MSCTRIVTRSFATVRGLGLLCVIVAGFACAVLGMTGCAGMGGFGEASTGGQEPPPTAGVIRQQIDATQTRLDTEIAEQQQVLVQAQETGDEAAKVRAEESIRAARQAGEWLAQARVLVPVNPDGSLDTNAAVTSASALLPPPWNIVGLIGLPLIAGAVGEWRRRKAVQDAKSIVNSIDALMVADPAVKSALKSVPSEAKAKAHEQLTPGAKALIDAESVT